MGDTLTAVRGEIIIFSKEFRRAEGMKLCADILYWRLKEKLTTVTQRGKGGSALTLNRPEFYLDRSQSFEKNRVYVCSADHLPKVRSWGKMCA